MEIILFSVIGYLGNCVYMPTSTEADIIQSFRIKVTMINLPCILFLYSQTRYINSRKKQLLNNQ